MNVSTVNAAAPYADWSRAAAGDAASAESFLALLAAQLQQQDPLEPMSTEAMLSQIAQLTTVSQITLLNQNFQALASAQHVTDVAVLLGRQVEWADAASNEIRSGVVTKVTLGDQGWEVCIGDTHVSIHDVVSVE